jgi:hypothetical protein
MDNKYLKCENNKLKCKICDKLFRKNITIYGITKHFKKIHNFDIVEKKPYIVPDYKLCPICWEKLKYRGFTKEFWLHKSNCSEKKKMSKCLL